MPSVLALLVGLVLAVAATATLVLTDEVQMLRLAVIAALWAFLIAAFVAGQRRSEPMAGPGTEVVPRRTHELELEREVAQRREYELQVEVQLRREVEGGLREELTALRGDVGRLRQDILERWDGELRVERVSVRAESTRVSGFGATFPAVRDVAQRLPAEGRPLFEVQGGEVEGRKPLAPGSAGEPLLAGAAGARPEALDTASTVEFIAVPATPPDPPPAAPPGTSGRLGLRRRHQAEDGPSAVDASVLLQRLDAEASHRPGLAPRRHRRADNDTNDVLARVLGNR